MTHLSDKELLEKMKEFPEHELDGEQKTRTLQSIRSQRKPKRQIGFSLQKAGAFAALLALFIIAPVLFSNEEGPNEPEFQTAAPVKKAESGEYFALKDNQGKPVYEDFNWGIPGSLSILRPEDWIAEDYRSGAKIMIHVWGNPDELVYKMMRIEGVHVDTGMVQELSTVELTAGMYGSDAHTVTSFKPFEKHGAWNLRFIVDGKLHEELSLYIKEPYVKIGDSTLMISQEDLAAGTFENIQIEAEGDSLPKELTLELFSFEDGTSEVFRFGEKQDFTRAATGADISVYTGDLTLEKSGKYRMTVLGQSVPVEVRKPADDSKK